MKNLVITINAEPYTSMFLYLQEQLPGIIDISSHPGEFQVLILKVTFNPRVIDADQIISILLERGFTVHYFCELA